MSKYFREKLLEEESKLSLEEYEQWVECFPAMIVLEEVKQLQINTQVEVARMATRSGNYKVFYHKQLDEIVDNVTFQGNLATGDITRFTNNTALFTSAKTVSDDLGKVCLHWQKGQGQMTAEWHDPKNESSQCKASHSAWMHCPASIFTTSTIGSCKELNFGDMSAWREAQKQTEGSSFTAATVKIEFNNYCDVNCNINFEKIEDGSSETVNVLPSLRVCPLQNDEQCTITFKYLDSTTSEWNSTASMSNFLSSYVITKKTEELATDNLAKWEVKQGSANGLLLKEFCQNSDVFGDHDTVQVCDQVNGFISLIWEKVLDEQLGNKQVTEVANIQVRLGDGSATPFNVTIKLQKADSDLVTYYSTGSKTVEIKYQKNWQANDNVPEKITELLQTVCVGFNNEEERDNFDFALCTDGILTSAKILTCNQELFWHAEDNLGNCAAFFLSSTELPQWMQLSQMNADHHIANQTAEFGIGE